MVESTVLIWILEVLTEKINRTTLPVNGSVRPHGVAAISPVPAGIIQARSACQWRPSINQRFHVRSRDKTCPLL
jgi:hypothetical protein